MSVPDLGRLVSQAERDTAGTMVTINQPDGRSINVPVQVGIFLMLGDISGNLAGIRQQLEALVVVQQVAQP